MRIIEPQCTPEEKCRRPRIDEDQIMIDRSMTPEERFHAVCEMTEFAMELQDAAAARRNGKVFLRRS